MKVKELSDEEVTTLITGLHYLSMNDKDFEFKYIIDDLLLKLDKERVFIGGKIWEKEEK